MIRQQVNLLAPMFRKQRALFSARISLAICGLVTLALALIYTATAWRGAALAGEQVRLQQQRDTVTRRLNELVAQIEGGQDKSLDARIASLTQERDRKLQALAALSRRELGNTTGFSPQFTGLASQRLEGLWLTRVQISGQQMTLAGVALAEELIPRYLARLGAEAVFAGTEFGHAQLQRVTEGGSEIRFELRTASDAP